MEGRNVKGRSRKGRNHTAEKLKTNYKAECQKAAIKMVESHI